MNNLQQTIQVYTLGKGSSARTYYTCINPSGIEFLTVIMYRNGMCTAKLGVDTTVHKFVSPQKANNALSICLMRGYRMVFNNRKFA